MQELPACNHRRAKKERPGAERVAQKSPSHALWPGVGRAFQRNRAGFVGQPYFSENDEVFHVSRYIRKIVKTMT